MQRALPPKLTEIARTALRIPEERRFAYLRQACAGDASLHRHAMAMFTPEITNPEWWADIPVTVAPVETDPTLGMIIGRYMVTGRLGSGGMSDVLLATPCDADGPDVAIKLIRQATASPQLHSRLKIERQILGTLDHPNIARLLDGGNTHGGIPYLVMEYLQGEPIDRYCDHHQLNIAQRLRLFQCICRAVHAAHGHSIIHRDLKPSNILVTADGVPKLLDFGIAKILDERQRQHTQVVTHADVRVVTPDYASPEQVRGDPLTIASDIYSLGVLLYELLTARNPLAAIRTERQQQAPDAALEGLPPPLDFWVQEPSDASSSQQAPWLMRLCELRSTSLQQLRSDFTGQLNTIVLAALAKAPEQRYASAESFATTIDEYLGTQPPQMETPANDPGPAESRTRRYVLAAIVTAALAAVAWFGLSLR